MYISCALFLFAAAGCGKQTPPTPPVGRAETVLDVYTAVEARDYQAALKKIARLREIAPGDIFLANLEVLTRNNSVIRDAQVRIENDDLGGAQKVVDEGIRRYGMHDDLVKAQKKLKVVGRIREILSIFKAPRDSEQLSAAAEQLKKIGSVYEPAAIFVPIAEKKYLEAEKMNKWEIRRAVDGLVSEINELELENDTDAEVLYAVLEIQDSLNPVLINYLEYLNGNEDVSLIIYPEENIFDNPEPENEDIDSSAFPEGQKDKPTVTEPREKSIQKEKTEKKPAEKSWWDKFTF